MSPSIFCCVICGYMIRDHGTPSEKWLKEFRAIYSTPDGGHFLSGVGSYDDIYGNLVAPTDHSKRFDDDDNDPDFEEIFFVTIYEEGKHAFVSHAVCWDLLREACKPKDIPLKRFLDVCDSLPLSLGGECFDWGHTYGGLYDFDYYESPYLSDCRLVGNPSLPETLQYATKNPYNIPELVKLLATTAHEPLGSILSPPGWGSNDCFGNFPWEIREAIANHLPTQDALTLRESSRSFHPLLESPTFWASRFQPEKERGFLYEKRKTKEPRDWLALYRGTNHVQCPPGLKNRKRIWDLIGFILQLLNLRLSDCDNSATHSDPSSDNDSTTHSNNSYENESRLILAAANIQQPHTLPRIGSGDATYAVLHSGCQTFRKQCASIPHDLTAVVMSFVGLGDYGHLSGLCFKSRNGTDSQLGYYTTESTDVFHVGNLRGFVLAIGPLGIRALQIIDNSGDRSRWFGFPKNTPVTERLAAFDTTKPVQVSIDAYKIVGIAATKAKDIRQPALEQSPPSLRTTALWYPSVPTSEIFLNEMSFIGARPPDGKYVPLHWVRFGGPRGGHLPHLASMWIGSRGRLPTGIKFTYQETASIKPVYIGDHEEIEYVEMHPNSIDGPGGEYIQTVQVAMRHRVCALKIAKTNGEAFEFGTLLSLHREPRELDPDAEYMTLDYDPATTITGFYTFKGFPGFGIISEAIER